MWPLIMEDYSCCYWQTESN